MIAPPCSTPVPPTPNASPRLQLILGYQQLNRCMRNHSNSPKKSERHPSVERCSGVSSEKLPRIPTGSELAATDPRVWSFRCDPTAPTASVCNDRLNTPRCGFDRSCLSRVRARTCCHRNRRSFGTIHPIYPFIRRIEEPTTLCLGDFGQGAYECSRSCVNRKRVESVEEKKI